jgi:hypothetical protein
MLSLAINRLNIFVALLAAVSEFMGLIFRVVSGVLLRVPVMMRVNTTHSLTRLSGRLSWRRSAEGLGGALTTESLEGWL